MTTIDIGEIGEGYRQLGQDEVLRPTDECKRSTKNDWANTLNAGAKVSEMDSTFVYRRKIEPEPTAKEPQFGEWWRNTGGRIMHVFGVNIYDIPEPVPKKHRAFGSMEEFAPHKDRWIKAKLSGSYARPTGFIDTHLRTGNSNGLTSFQEAFEQWEFEDGCPFGVEVSE